MIHHSIHHELLRATFFLLSTRPGSTPIRTIAGVNLDVGFSEIIICLIVKSPHLHNIDAINSLCLHVKNSRTLLAIVVRDILATIALSREGLQRARQNLVLVARDHEIV